MTGYEPGWEEKKKRSCEVAKQCAGAWARACWMKKFLLYLNQTSAATKLIYFCCSCRWLTQLDIFTGGLSLNNGRRSGDLWKVRYRLLSAKRFRTFSVGRFDKLRKLERHAESFAFIGEESFEFNGFDKMRRLLSDSETLSFLISEVLFQLW